MSRKHLLQLREQRLHRRLRDRLALDLDLEVLFEEPRGMISSNAHERRFVCGAPVGIAETHAHHLAVRRARLDRRGNGMLAGMMLEVERLGDGDQLAFQKLD